MAKLSLNTLFDKVKSNVGLPVSVDIRAVSTIDGSMINRKKEIQAVGLRNYLDGIDGSVRVASFLRQLELRMGAQVGARFELHFAGQKVDGRRSLATLR